MKSILRIAALFFAALFFFGGRSYADRNPSKLIDSSHMIFLSTKLQKQIGDYQSFPVFWWNFLVRNISSEKDGPLVWTELQSQCIKLKNLSNLVSKVDCQENLKDFTPLILDWAKDLPLRQPLPSDQILTSKIDGAMTYASLPLSDHTLLDIFRMDPFESWKILKAKAEAKIKINFPRENGFFFDGQSGRVIIPIQMAFPPSQSKKTTLFMGELKALHGDWYFIGPHGSHLQNETQVIQDVHQVSKLGTVLLVIFGLTLFFLKKWKVVILIMPVSLAMIVSTALTILIFGSIHGLTLSFGTAIVGLALDYGLQAAFNNNSPHLWRANLFGLLTTLVGLLVLMTSSMPLLRQMMIFASIGIVTAFALMYLLFKLMPERFIVTPLNILPRPHFIKTLLAGMLILSSVVSLFVLKPTMDMSRFDYQDPQTFEITKWLFKSLNLRAPLFNVLKEEEVFEKAFNEKAWADKNKIQLENFASYVPSFDAQTFNIRTWHTPRCKNYFRNMDPTKKRFFEPLLKENLCQASLLDFSSSRSYLHHLNSGSKWLSLWLPASDEEESAIRRDHFGVISIKEIVSEIPLSLSKELKWMAPLSIFLAFCFLFFYYRDFINTGSALIPFLSGMGLVSCCIWIFQLNVSFISIIGLVMVFGFSIDYGIFATDICAGLRGRRGEIERGVWTGLTLAVVTTCAGFAPLLFCKHPILLGLGQTLFIGAVGTFIGAIWGIPGFFEVIKRQFKK